MNQYVLYKDQAIFINVLSKFKSSSPSNDMYNKNNTINYHKKLYMLNACIS